MRRCLKPSEDHVGALDVPAEPSTRGGVGPLRESSIPRAAQHVPFLHEPLEGAPPRRRIVVNH